MAVTKENSANASVSVTTAWTFSFGYTPADGNLIVVCHYTGAGEARFSAAEGTKGWVRAVDSYYSSGDDEVAIYAIVADGVINDIDLEHSAAKDGVATVVSFDPGTLEFKTASADKTESDSTNSTATIETYTSQMAAASEDDAVSVWAVGLGENANRTFSNPTESYTLLGEYIREQYRAIESGYRIFTTAAAVSPEVDINTSVQYGAPACVASWIVEAAGGADHDLLAADTGQRG